MSLQTNTLVTTTLLPHHTPTLYQPHTLLHSHITLALTPIHLSLPHLTLTPYDSHLLHWLLLLHSNVRNTGVYHKGKQVQQKMGWPAEEWRETEQLQMMQTENRYYLGPLPWNYVRMYSMCLYVYGVAELLPVSCGIHFTLGIHNYTLDCVPFALWTVCSYCGSMVMFPQWNPIGGTSYIRTQNLCASNG